MWKYYGPNCHPDSTDVAQGTAIVDFGPFPGSQTAQGVVTGQSGLVSTSLAEAWVWPNQDTADHPAVEQQMDWQRIQVAIINMIPGVGFTIAAQLYPGNANLYGKYTVAWVWN